MNSIVGSPYSPYSPMEIIPSFTPYPSIIEYRDNYHSFLHRSLRREKTIPVPFVADTTTLKSLDIEETFHAFITNSRSGALGFEGKMYPAPVLEFISSFSCKRVEDRVVEWSFRIGNEEFTYNKWKLGILFGFPTEGGVVPMFEDDELHHFWKELSTMDVYEPDMSPKCIGLGVWKYLHRLIALNVNTRCDNGSVVTPADLNIMLAIRKGLPIDYTHILGTRFEEWQNLSSPNGALGGAIFIEQIVENEFYTLDHLVPSSRPLNSANLVLTRMLHSKEGLWVHTPKMGVKTLAKERRLEKQRKGKQVVGECSSHGMRKRRTNTSVASEAGSTNEAMIERWARIEQTQHEMAAKLTKLVEDSDARWEVVKGAMEKLVAP